MTSPKSLPEGLRARVQALGLHGLDANWAQIGHEPWIERLVDLEDAERRRRSLERRIKSARLGRFRAMTDFDWSWPKKIDRELVEELMGLDFAEHGTNVVLLGPNGVGKTTLAQNLAHQALLRGWTVRCTTASDMLHDLGAQETTRARTARLRQYTNAKLLLIDEVGYLSYDTRYADLLFEVITRRYEQSRSVVLTTNKPFGEWGQVFPNAACVVTLVDRLMHRAEIVTIEAESYRLHEATERASQRAKKKTGKRLEG